MIELFWKMMKMADGSTRQVAQVLQAPYRYRTYRYYELFLS
jgi:hypothetical protein